MAKLPYEMNKSKVRVPMLELDPVERSQTFEEVAAGYTPEEAILEAQRCIQCKNEPCVSGCPVGVPIPQFLAQLAQGQIGRAYALVNEASALPAICGRVCPQETQCEGVCTRGRNGEPVAIGRLERFVSDWAFEHPVDAAMATVELKQARADQRAAAQKEQADAAANPAASTVDAGQGGEDEAAAARAKALLKEPHDLSGKRVAVIGSGPASLTCAGELGKLGCEVTVYECLHQLGGVLTYGIPEFRLPKDLVSRELSKLGDHGVTFETNALIGRLYSIDELIDEHNFDAVFVGTGAGLPSYLNIEGEGLNGVMVANELLTRVNLMKAYRFPEFETPVYAGKQCVIVGGGNVAMDAARTARRLGAEVTVVYRRSREEMPAREEEIHHAEQEGIKFQLLSNPVRILGNEDGWVEGVECVQMELGEPDASGRRRPHEVEGSEFVIPSDMVVVSIGSRTNPLIAQTTPGLEVTSRNLIVADEKTCETTRPGIFAGGDVVIGAATVILAMGAGKRAAAGIADYLVAKDEPAGN